MAESRYPLSELDTLPDDIKAKVVEVAEKAGFIPNVFLGMAHRPDEFRAFFAYYDAVMERPGNLTKAEKEMIVVATSATNECLYCVVSHGAFLRIYSKDPLLGDQVAVNYRKAGLTDRQRAMLDFATKVAQRSQEVTDGDFEALHAHGFDDEDIWDIGAITALFALSNRMANVTGMQPNDEFYTMGRAPRKA